MTERDDVEFTELFEVIEAYSRRGYYHQDKALQIITGTYVFMFEEEEMPDVRPIIDDILGQYGYVFTTLERGNLDPLSVDAVVRVALYNDEYMEWGINRLGRILESLHRRSRADENDLGHKAAAQEAARVRLLDAGDLFGGSCRDDLATRVSAFGSEVDDVVPGPDHIEVVLDDDDGIPRVNEPVQDREQLLHVREVEPGGRLVQDVYCLARRPLAQLARQLYTLRFAARERGRRLSEPDVAEADVAQGIHA